MTNRRINKKYQKENDSIDSLGVVFSNSREKDVIINSIIVSDWRSKRELFLMGIGFIFLILFIIGIYFYSLGSQRFHLIGFGISFSGFLVLTSGFITYIFDYFKFRKYRDKYDKEIVKTAWKHFEQMQEELLEEIREKQNKLEEIGNDE